MHYGMKNKNPLDFVKFYPKTRPNGMLHCTQCFLNTISNQYLLECFRAQRGDLSLLMPNQFGEVLLRVYTKDVRFVLHPSSLDVLFSRHSRFFGIVQAGYRSLMQRMTAQSDPSIDVQGSESDGIIERPRTPRTASRVSSFNKSFSVEPGDSDENESPFLNQFTTVGRGYGKSLAHPTSPSKTLGPRPVSAPVPGLALEPLLEEDRSMDAQPPLQAPTSPTAAKREPKTPVAVSVSEDNTPPAGGIDSPGIGDDSTEVALLSGNPDRGRGLRSSKRLREDRGGGSKAREQPGSGSTPSKRRKS